MPAGQTAWCQPQSSTSAKNWHPIGNVMLLTSEPLWDFPGGPVAKTPCSQCRGLGSIPGQGTKIPHATTKSLAKSDKEIFLKRKKENRPFILNLGPEQQEIPPKGRCHKPLLQRWHPSNQAEGQVSAQEHQLKPAATGSMWHPQGPCHRTTESTSYLHVAVELN